MTLKEFLENNPEAIKEASKCQNVREFKELTEKVGIEFDSEEKLHKAFNLVKNQNVMELSDDALDAVSGGARQHQQGFRDPVTGDILTIGTGKKV